MKYYSEITTEFYDTPEKCEEAEAAHRKELEAIKAEAEGARKQHQARKEELDEAYREAVEALKKYDNLKKAYYKDYPRTFYREFFW